MFSFAHTHTVQISLNGVDWTISGQEFMFYDHARIFISLLEPEGGPIAGGTQLLVHGSAFRQSEHLRCSWDDNTSPSLKVEATWVGYHTLACISPPIGSAGARSLEIALDDFHYTDINRQWTYYDPQALVISALDPIGGPVSGGTLLDIIGSGFAKLGGAVQHGSSYFPADNPDPHKPVHAGVFCKFSIDTVRSARGQAAECTLHDEHHYSAYMRSLEPQPSD